MKLEELYKLRKNFTIIGLTGRSGSGCSTVAKKINGTLDDLLETVRSVDFTLEDNIKLRKLNICKNYLTYPDNWQRYQVIEYKKILIFFLVAQIFKKEIDLNNILNEVHQYSIDINIPLDTNNSELISKSILKLCSESELKANFDELQITEAYKLKSQEDLGKLYRLYFESNFSDLSDQILLELSNTNYYFRTLFLHKIALNIRSNGSAQSSESETSDKFINTLAELINRIIKSAKNENDSKELPTKIVIDSLRNSLEIMFFKERYSAFYMISVNNLANTNAALLNQSLPSQVQNKEAIVTQLLQLDKIEYSNDNFAKGNFGSQDVENCIQKSDIYISIADGQIDENFTTSEQILKIISLIQQPGIITPSAEERCMQIAYNAKLNSGCISRQVGAVITDKNYSVKAVGWNDVPHGTTPCNLRNVKDYYTRQLPSKHYSKFERGDGLEGIETEYKYKFRHPYNFPDAITDYYPDVTHVSQVNSLAGRNCSFCFKSIHNFYEGEKNQVHTKSLHAEENAMLQISKWGGQPLKDGILFTTASPCELCSKKALQLGVSKIYYIDPYPGISNAQILSNTSLDVKMLNFTGAIGKAYNKLYEPFMAYKDELSILIPPTPSNISPVVPQEIQEKVDEFLKANNWSNYTIEIRTK